MSLQNSKNGPFSPDLPKCLKTYTHFRTQYAYSTGFWKSYSADKNQYVIKYQQFLTDPKLYDVD